MFSAMFNVYASVAVSCSSAQCAAASGGARTRLSGNLCYWISEGVDPWRDPSTSQLEFL